MPTYSHVAFEMSVADPTASYFPALQKKFQHALYQHNVENDRSSILCWAAGQGHVSLMETLHDQYHADVNAVHGCNTPLIKAVMSGSLAAVEYLLSRSEVDLGHFDQGHRALWYSTAQKDPAIAQRLLRQPGINMNRPLRAKNGNTLTIFNEAVIRNNTEVVKVLLADEQADPNIPADNMRTPLLCATDRGQAEIVKILLGDSRVDPVRQDARGCSALHYAAERGDVQLVDLLLADGRINVNSRNCHQSTALHLAAKAGHLDAVNRLLMASTININAKNRKGRTALWNATCQGHDQVASRLLIEEDVEVNTTGTDECTDRSTSLHHAVERRNLVLVHQLLDKSTADPNVPDEDGQTPLCWAAFAGDRLLILSLLSDPRTQRYTKDKSGRTPVDIAKSGKHYEIVCLLMNCRHHCPGVIFANAIMSYPLAAVVKWALAQCHILEWK